MSSSVPALDPVKLDACMKAADALATRMDAMCVKRADAAFVKWSVTVAKKEGGEKKTISVHAGNKDDAARFAHESLGDQNAGKWATVSAMRSDSLDGKFQHHKGKDNVRPDGNTPADQGREAAGFNGGTPADQGRRAAKDK